MDIGGSLTKIAYYSVLPLKKIAYASSNQDPPNDAVYEMTEGARLHFIKFETKHIETTLDYIQQSLLSANLDVKEVKVTGGGAYKFADLIENKLGLRIAKEDEMECMIRGCNFLLRNISEESFSYQKKDDPVYSFQTSNPQDMFPYLPVNYRVGRATTGHINAVLLNRNVHVGKWGEEQINSRCPRTSRPKSRTPQCFLDF